MKDENHVLFHHVEAINVGFFVNLQRFKGCLKW
jgi:hypothetical protein